MVELRTDSVFDALQQPLDLVDDPERRQAFARYVEAARIPLERAVFDLLSATVDAVNAEVQAHYQLRLHYRPGALELEVKPQEEPRPDVAGTAWQLAEGDVEKVTIRIPAELKELVVQAAGRAGTSLNSWFVRTLARTLRDLEEGPPGPPPPPRRGPGARLTGWIGDE